MTEPVVAAKEPAGVKLEGDKAYFWCACGKSAAQPFCDGAHKETGIAPMRFKPDEDCTAWLCQCKMTKSPPYCDGSHKAL